MPPVSGSTPLHELDLSVRTLNFLGSLGVTTFGELLALRQIRLPKSVPLKVGAMMLRDLRELFSEHDVEYAGELIGPVLQVATLTASGSVAERWATITAWLLVNAPLVLSQFRPAAGADDIANAERALKVNFPDDYKTFLSIHDGQNEFAAMVGGGALLPIEEVTSTWRRIQGEQTKLNPERVDQGIRAVDCSSGWIPISRSARGRDYLCIDLDPAQGGVQGQIIEYVVDSNERRLIAKSFADLLSLYFVQLQSGELTFDDEDLS